MTRSVRSSLPHGPYVFVPAEWVRSDPLWAVAGVMAAAATPAGKPQRADVGRKIQRVPAKLGPIARPVAAMYQFHSAFPHKTSISRTASPSTAPAGSRRTSCGWHAGCPAARSPAAGRQSSAYRNIRQSNRRARQLHAQCPGAGAPRSGRCWGWRGGGVRRQMCHAPRALLPVSAAAATQAARPGGWATSWRHRPIWRHSARNKDIFVFVAEHAVHRVDGLVGQRQRAPPRSIYKAAQ